VYLATMLILKTFQLASLLSLTAKLQSRYAKESESGVRNLGKDGVGKFRKLWVGVRHLPPAPQPCCKHFRSRRSKRVILYKESKLCNANKKALSYQTFDKYNQKTESSHTIVV